MAHTPATSGFAPLSAELIEELHAALDDFSPRVQARGRHYADTHRVGALTYQGQKVSAMVRGTQTYYTMWQAHDGDWVPECTCPVGPYCKHAYALACCILQENRPEDPPRRRDSGGRADTAASRESRALRRLEQAQYHWEREYALSELLAKAPRGALSGYLPRFQEVLREPDAEIMCWRLANEVARVSGGWLPSPLEAYRQRDDLSARYLERARGGLARELVSWAQTRGQTTRSLRTVLHLSPNPDGSAAVLVEPRLTTPRKKDDPRAPSQLVHLRSEARHRQGLLPPEQLRLLELLVEQAERNPHSEGGSGFSTRYLKLLLDQVSGTPLATWAADVPAELAQRAGISPGGVVRLRPEPARLLPLCTSGSEGPAIELAYVWPDESRRHLDEVVIVRDDGDWLEGEPSLVLADGQFSLVAEEPPRKVRQHFEQAGQLPLTAAERPEMLRVLASSFPHLQRSLEPHTRRYAVTPAVALDLRGDDRLQIRVFACADADEWRPGEAPPPEARVFEYTADRDWKRLDSAPLEPTKDEFAAIHAEEPPASSPPAGESEGDAAATSGIEPAEAPVELAEIADAWIELPDPRTVEPLIAWLERSPATPLRRSAGALPGTREERLGWWIPAGRKHMERFAEAWEERPREARYFGTERVRRLLSGASRAVPQLTIRRSGVDFFTVSAEWSAEGMQLTEADLAKLRAATTRFVKLPSGWMKREVVESHDEVLEALADLGVDPYQGEQPLGIWQLAGARPENLQMLEEFGADADALSAARELRQRIEEFRGIPVVPLPDGVTAELRPYQRQGLDFLAYTASLGLGAVLADDMGLGKTVQALAWLCHMRRVEPQAGPALVVCPASVVHNWQREAERFTPGLRILLLTRGQERHELRREIPAHDLVVTNYALLRRDIEQWQEIELCAAILDEAQNIKNPDAAVTKAALSLRARHRLALTGTPLENRAMDLWSIMSFVNPGYLGTRGQFAQRFDHPEAPSHARSLLGAKLRPVLLRRTKQEVAPELPERVEERHDCELNRAQRLLYLAELKKARARVDELSRAPGGVRENKIAILAALTRLRQICCHPALAGGKRTVGSGKFDAVFELIEEILAEGHKVLLFSQFVECLKLLRQDLEQRGIPYHMLTGQTTKREQVVAGFQEDPRACVFLVSLRAGGTGLNLTSASYVVLFDPWWNPAVEAQAIDRTHRIGQTRNVIAYRLLALGTIEEKIWELQQRKAALARDILGENGFARSLTKEDLSYLLSEE